MYLDGRYQVTTAFSLTVAQAHVVEFSNVPPVSHLNISVDCLGWTGTTVAGLLAATTVNVYLEGVGTIVPDIPILTLAKIADLESGLVQFVESTSSVAPILTFGYPLGLFGLDGADSLRVTVNVPANTGGTSVTDNNSTILNRISISLANKVQMMERFVYQLSRITHTLTAGGTKDKTYPAQGLQKLWLQDTSRLTAKIDVKPSIGRSYRFTLNDLKAWTRISTNQESAIVNPTLFNDLYPIWEVDGSSALAETVKTEFDGAVAGDITVFARNLVVRTGSRNRVNRLVNQVAQEQRAVAFRNNASAARAVS